jgi:short-subunit dehydrogenase
MKTTALITGASNGIGLEFAKVFAANNNNLVLVARSGEKLNQIANQLCKDFGITVRVMTADLSKMEEVQQVYNTCKTENIKVDYLVNNAGFGDFGFFVESDWKKTERMIDLNIKSLTLLSRLFGADMVAHKSGKILNVASTAAFQPGPTMAVYYATKSYVMFLSEAMSNELKGTGVTVTCLCPGATESGFQAAAAMEESALVKNKKLPTSAEVALFGYKAMMKGKLTVIHGVMNQIMANSIRFTPRSWVLPIVRKVQGHAK